MQVSPINSLNFNGRLKKNPLLEKMVSDASDNVIERLGNVLERASKVRDFCLYEISSNSFINPASLQKETVYNLYKQRTNFNSKHKVLEKRVSVPHNNSNKLGDILNEFIPVLELIYPDKVSKIERKFLLEKIKKNLV